MIIDIASPISGEVKALSTVSDPVFAQSIVGPGIAITPVRSSQPIHAIAPISGRVIKLFPHAYAVEGTNGVSVLVHLGIDTVTLKGEGFTPHVAEGDNVRVGDIIVTWDTSIAEAAELDTVVPVIVLGAENQKLTPLVWPGTPTLEGGPLLHLE